MKFKNFMEEYGGWILIAIIALVALSTFVLPVLVAVGRSLWQWALSETVYWG